MKLQKLVMLGMFFLLVVPVYGASPLIGRWKFKEIIGGSPFTDYITISSVSATTKKISGYWTQYPGTKVAGYYYGNFAFIETKGSDIFLDGWNFTFQGTPIFAKHLGIFSFSHDFDTSWDKLTATKLSSSASASTVRLSESAMRNQQRLKREAYLQERRNSISEK